MQAIRRIYKVENQKLVIELPDSFQHTEGAIILSVSAKDENLLPNSIDRGTKEALSNLCVWNEADEQEVIEIQNLIDQ